MAWGARRVAWRRTGCGCDGEDIRFMAVGLHGAPLQIDAVNHFNPGGDDRSSRQRAEQSGTHTSRSRELLKVRREWRATSAALRSRCMGIMRHDR
jgi:hypothetical protein